MWLKNYGRFPSIVSVVTVVLLFGGASWKTVTGVTLESNGGYNILVAIDDTVEEPGNSEQYFGHVKASLNEFSITLARVTKGKFFINSAEILIPTTWNATAQLASTQSTTSSDIHLSVENTLPFVDNPHFCGLPGNQIQLPYTFFNSPTGGVYGESRKALLTLWARFRWGVYEEHGFPGDSRLPYFYLGSEPDLWQETSCSNTPLVGEYENLNGEECTVEQADRPEEDCRFIPSPINVASSSLMGFHWMESVTEFCDETTHNAEAPNRQNLFCNHRSIWEVIRTTPDFQAAPVYASEIPTIRFRTVKHSAIPTRPVFLLLDSGALDGHSSSIIIQVMPVLGTLFATMRDTLLVSLAEYPGEEYNQIRELVPWNTLGVNREAMIEHVGSVEFGGPENRDFTTAIQRAIWEIEKMQFQTGAALIVVKTGTYLSFNVQYEESIYTALAKNRIKLYAAEVTNPEGEGDAFIPPTLKRLSERTGGGHVDLANDQDVAEKVEAMTIKIMQDVLVPADPAVPVEILSQKFQLEYDTDVRVDLQKRSTVSIQLSVPKRVEALLTIEGPQNPMVEIADEWIMPGEHLRKTHTYIHEYNEADEELTLRSTCMAEPADLCGGAMGFLIITEKFHEDAQDHESNRLKITVTTSAVPRGNFMDFQQATVPFVIYAKVELDGKPVENARVVATPYVGAEESAMGEVELLDNGLGTPDVETLDGIYSGTYVPTLAGEYTVSVRVSSSLPEANVRRTTSSKASSRLLPVDQIDIVVPPECGVPECDTALLTDAVSVTGDLPTSVAFSNVDQYPGLNQAEKIMDFVAEKSRTVQDQINFRWTSPKILGKAEKVWKFQIIAAAAHSDLIGQTSGEITIIRDIDDEEIIQNPGGIQTHSEIITNPNFLYYAVQSFASGQVLPSEAISTVSRIYWEPEEIDVTTTTVTPPPTNPTVTTANPTVPPTPNPTQPPTTTNPGGNNNNGAGGTGTPFWHTLLGIGLIVLSLYWEWGW